MKRLTIAILMTMFASPALALDRRDANYIGHEFGENVCHAVWNGAKSQDEALVKGINALSKPVVEDFKTLVDIMQEYGEDHVISEAYFEGYAEEMVSCWTEYQSLP
jgi:hypothetical protein